MLEPHTQNKTKYIVPRNIAFRVLNGCSFSGRKLTAGRTKKITNRKLVVNKKKPLMVDKRI